jgi:hypothetical protein
MMSEETNFDQQIPALTADSFDDKFHLKTTIYYKIGNDSKTYQIKRPDKVLLLFYSPSCPHCVHLTPNTRTFLSLL